jgi:hypothetical protein
MPWMTLEEAIEFVGSLPSREKTAARQALSDAMCFGVADECAGSRWLVFDPLECTLERAARCPRRGGRPSAGEVCLAVADPAVSCKEGGSE